METLTLMRPHGGVEVVWGPGHVLLRALAPGLVGGESLALRLLGRVGGARALLARVGVGVGIGHPRAHGVTPHRGRGGVQKVASAATSPATGERDGH